MKVGFAALARRTLNLPSGPGRSRARSLIGRKGARESVGAPATPPAAFLPPHWKQTTTTNMETDKKIPNKGGRPHEDNPLMDPTPIRFRAEELASLKAKAKAANMNVSMFVRKAITRANVTPVNIEAVREYRMLRANLVRIENDINQLTKRAIYAKNKKEIQQVMDELAQSEELICQLKPELEKLKNTMKG